MKSFDVAVIGGGPGGYSAALRAAGHGLSTVLIEREPRLGGTCLLRGCIPTKCYLETARRMEEACKSGDYAIRLSFPGSQSARGDDGEDVTASVDMDRLQKRKDRIISRLATGIAGLCRKKGVEVIRGTGRLKGRRGAVLDLFLLDVVDQEGAVLEEIQAKNVILATGSRVKALPGIIPDGERILTSDSALTLKQVPSRLLVLGSGAVGLEFACAFRAFGSEVTIVELADRVLPMADREISEEALRSLKRRGIQVMTSTSIPSVRKTESGVSAILASRSGDTPQETMEADALLCAVGRETCLDGLGLDQLGVEAIRGKVPVSDSQETCVPGLYAIGDLTQSPDLAHVASREGIIAADAIAGVRCRPIADTPVPSAVYSTPEIAFVGQTEEAARKDGRDIAIGRHPFIASGKAVVEGATEGFVKTVADRATGRLLGAHIIGQHATELIGEFSLAIASGLTVQSAIQAILPHPTLSETLGESLMAAMEDISSPVKGAQG